MGNVAAKRARSERRSTPTDRQARRTTARADREFTPFAIRSPGEARLALGGIEDGLSNAASSIACEMPVGLHAPGRSGDDERCPPLRTHVRGNDGRPICRARGRRPPLFAPPRRADCLSCRGRLRRPIRVAVHTNAAEVLSTYVAQARIEGFHLLRRQLIKTITAIERKAPRLDALGPLTEREAYEHLRGVLQCRRKEAAAEPDDEVRARLAAAVRFLEATLTSLAEVLR